MAKQTQCTHLDRVGKWEDPNEYDTHFVITLKPGWAFYPNQNIKLARHRESFNTAQVARTAVKSTQHCNCHRCACPSKRVA